MCVDIANPSPAIGFCNRERASFLDRIRADCVLALAVIHHLHVTANLPVSGIRDMFADLCRRDLVLESLARVADNVTGGVIDNCGHFIPEEAPDVLLQAFDEFFKD